MVKNVAVTNDLLAVEREDGRTISVPIGWYPRLACGTPEEQQNDLNVCAGRPPKMPPATI